MSRYDDNTADNEVNDVVLPNHNRSYAEYIFFINDCGSGSDA